MPQSMLPKAPPGAIRIGGILRAHRAALLATLLFLLTPMVVSLSGCSLAGSLIGGAWDRQHPQPDRELDPGELGRVHKGDMCAVVLQDSTIVRGIYLGLEPKAPGAETGSARRLRFGTGGAVSQMHWSVGSAQQHGISGPDVTWADTTRVNSADVRVILMPGGHPGQHFGTLAGITVDAVLIIALVRQSPRAASSTGCDPSGFQGWMSDARTSR